MRNSNTLLTPRVLVLLLLFVVIEPFLPLLISRHWGWWEAWVYALTSILGFIVSRALARRRHPDLLAERSRFLRHENAKSWDRLLAPLIGVGGGLVLVVAGLDELFNWSADLSLAVKIASLLIILAGYALSSWALVENRFFSGMVRLQFDRGQHVVASGPYAWVRHPGYAGALLVFLCTPLFLDSTWAFIPAVLLTLALLVRTYLEDMTLQGELPGYADYARRVRFRLLPGIW